MKKIFFCILTVLFVFTLPVYAATTIDEGQTVTGWDDASAGTGNSTSIGKLSTGVSLGWEGNDVAYAITTYHGRGSTVFGTAADSTSIYRLVDQTEITEPAASDSSEFSDWDEL